MDLLIDFCLIEYVVCWLIDCYFIDWNDLIDEFPPEPNKQCQRSQIYIHNTYISHAIHVWYIYLHEYMNGR